MSASKYYVELKSRQSTGNIFLFCYLRYVSAVWKKLSFGKNLSLFYLGSSSAAIDQSVSNVLNKANIALVTKLSVVNDKSIETQ